MARFACLVAVCLIALATLAPTAIGIAGVCDEDACTGVAPVSWTVKDFRPSHVQ
jgi:hypothetical protein